MKAVVFGGGNIGRGFLGQLLFESGFETVFVDINQMLLDELNARNRYPIKIVCNEYQKEITVEEVTDIMKTTMDLHDDTYAVVVRSLVHLEDTRCFEYSESVHRLDKFRFVEFARRRKV